MKLIQKHKKVFSLILLMVIGISIGSIQQLRAVNSNSPSNLPKFSQSMLSKYNGDDPNTSIYIGLNGYVYDVTSGKDFYKTGAAYHDLAGKDSSKLLNVIGGDIIKRKYPVIGQLSN